MSVFMYVFVSVYCNTATCQTRLGISWRCSLTRACSKHLDLSPCLCKTKQYQIYLSPCLYNSIQYNARPSNTKSIYCLQGNALLEQYHAGLYNTIQYHVIACNNMQYHTPQYNTTQHEVTPLYISTRCQGPDHHHCLLMRTSSSEITLVVTLFIKAR